MSRLETTIATTHVDLHNERLALSALEGMVEQANTQYIPIGVEHDPRYPPMGRVIKAEIIALADGEYGVKATWELFDGDHVRSDVRRAMPVNVDDIDRFEVAYDRTIAQRDDRRDVAELARLAGAPPKEMGKKALEPLGELVLRFGEFALGGIALGIFAKIGEDVWTAVKERLVERSEASSGPELLVHSVGVRGPARPVEVLVILSDPSPTTVASYFDYGFRDVDGLVEYALRREADVARIVLRWDAGGMKLAYAVRWDATPVLVDQSMIPPIPKEWLEVSAQGATKAEES